MGNEVAPRGFKDGRTSPQRLQMLAMASILYGLAELRQAMQQRCIPHWAQRVFSAMPAEARDGIRHMDTGWFDFLLAMVLRPRRGTVVYCLFSHSGFYISKANLVRAREAAQITPTAR